MTTPTTTIEAIRDQMITVIEGLTPRSLARNRYRVRRGIFAFEDWAEEQGRARNFRITNVTDRGEPDGNDTLITKETAELLIQIVYPKRRAKWGSDGVLDLEDAMDQDARQIYSEIGPRGFDLGNYVSGQHAAIRISDFAAEQENVFIRNLTFEVHFYQDATQ